MVANGGLQEGQGNRMKTEMVVAFLEWEAYALEHGYSVKDSGDGGHSVYKRGRPIPVANCPSHLDAICVAYDLAKGYQTAGRQMA